MNHNRMYKKIISKFSSLKMDNNIKLKDIIEDNDDKGEYLHKGYNIKIL